MLLGPGRITLSPLDDDCAQPFCGAFEVARDYRGESFGPERDMGCSLSMVKITTPGAPFSRSRLFPRAAEHRDRACRYVYPLSTRFDGAIVPPFLNTLWDCARFGPGP